jgi:hypothetical protein
MGWGPGVRWRRWVEEVAVEKVKVEVVKVEGKKVGGDGSAMGDRWAERDGRDEGGGDEGEGR